MAKEKLHLDWKGYYLYNSSNLDKYVPEEAGVYKLSVKLKNGKLRVFYVGQTDDLYRRLNEHLEDNEENECIKDNVQNYKCKFKFALVSSKKNRDGAERALYFHYEPECNDAGAIPSEPDIEINYD